MPHESPQHAPSNSVPRGTRVHAKPINRWTRKNVAGMTPGQLAQVLKRAERGDLEDWFDTAEYMLRTDPHLRSVYKSLISPVAGAELTVIPNDEDPQGEEVAEFCRNSWKRIKRRSQSVSALLHGEGVGLSALEHNWRRINGEWHSVRMHPITPRDTRFGLDWVPEVRTYALSKHHPNGEWISTGDEPNRWLTHVPGEPGIAPNLAGALMAVAWPWLFKRWALVWGQSALERTGEGFFLGKTPANAEEPARLRLLETLENLSSGHAAVIEDGELIEILEVTSQAGSGHRDMAAWFDDQITKGLLGSTLNVDVGSTGGNRALGESQADETILPRRQEIARSAAETLRDQWCRPLLRFNASLFGRIPEPPELDFQLEQEELPVVDDLAVQVGAVTIDEVRISRGHTEWGDERGLALAGQALAAPVSAPMRPEPKPGEQLSLPGTAEPEAT